MARRPRSLMLTFMEADTAENGPILCTEVLNALIEADIQKDSIEGIEAPRRNKYFVVFKEFASRRLNINKRIQIREKWYRLEHPNPSPQYTSKTRVRIFYYPLDEDTKNLEIVLKHYGLFSEGSIKDLERETETEGEKEEAEKTNTMETENEEKTTEQSKETAAEKENTSKETAPAKPEEKENTNEKDEKETERNLETDEKKEDSDSTTLGEESEESDGNREKDTKWQVVGKRKRNNRKTTTKAKKESVEQGAGKKSEPPETKL